MKHSTLVVIDKKQLSGEIGKELTEYLKTTLNGYCNNCKPSQDTREVPQRYDMSIQKFEREKEVFQNRLRRCPAYRLLESMGLGEIIEEDLYIRCPNALHLDFDFFVSNKKSK